MSNQQKMKSFLPSISSFCILMVVVTIVQISLPMSFERGRLRTSSIYGDMRTLTKGLELYFTDHQAYPKAGAGESLPNVLTTPVSYFKSFPDDQFKTTRLPKNKLESILNGIGIYHLGASIFLLTIFICILVYRKKPINLLTSIGTAFAAVLLIFNLVISYQLLLSDTPVLITQDGNQSNSKSFNYATTAKHFILQSVGPDRRRAVENLHKLLENTVNNNMDQSEILSYTFDPTNGTLSSGDLLRMNDSENTI